jgi:hypothetical protein
MVKTTELNAMIDAARVNQTLQLLERPLEHLRHRPAVARRSRSPRG